MRSLAPPLRGEGRGEGCFHKRWVSDLWRDPSPQPSPPEEGGEGALAESYGIGISCTFFGT
jgi:hypothetical protein